jgi:protein-disulfide isomerase
VAALQERSVGDSAAPVTVIEYASMTCHHCADFHNNTFETFKQRYIDTGKVRLIYRDFPLDGIALRAATMARCIDGEQYFELVQRIYKDQNNWTHTRDPIAELTAIGWMSGLDQVMLKACLTSENLVDGVLNIRQQGAAKGVVSTPSFVINDVVYPGNRSIEELSAIIDPLLESK